MGLLDRLTGWLEPPSVEFYRCTDCGGRFVDAYPSCPECDGELEEDGTPETPASYWGPM